MNSTNYAFDQDLQIDDSNKVSEASFPAFRRVVQSPDFDNPQWEKRISARMKELISLPRGWDGYSGQAVSFNRAAFAYLILNRLYIEDLPLPSLVPGSDGTLQIEWHVNGFDIELDVLDVHHVLAYLANQNDGKELELEIRSDFTQVWEWLKKMNSNDASEL